MLDRIVATGSLVLRAVGGTRSGEMAAHRLLSSEDVDPAALLAPHVTRTAAACAGRRVVAAQDTSEINFDRRRKPAAGLGPTGNTDIRGFFVHPVVAIDADDEAVLGVVGARIWTRAEAATPDHRGIPFDEKESDPRARRTSPARPRSRSGWPRCVRTPRRRAPARRCRGGW